MFSVMHCENCKSDHLEMDSVSFILEMSHSKWCEHCYHSNQRKLPLMFCSTKCLFEYMRNPEKEAEFCKMRDKFKADKMWAIDEPVSSTPSDPSADSCKNSPSPEGHVAGNRPRGSRRG